MTNEESVELHARWQSGDELAAEAIFDSYVGRLVALARERISPRVNHRIEPEDVVQSVFRTFFRRARDGSFSSERDGDLWRRLAAITVKKVRKSIRFHQADKRDVRCEQSSFVSDFDLALEAVSDEPTADEVAGVIEEVEYVMEGLSPLHRQILELRLQGHGVSEIAKEVERTQRTVRRVLEAVREGLWDRLSGSASHPPEQTHLG